MREFLDEIVHCKRLELEERKKKKPLEELISTTPERGRLESLDFLKAISRPKGGSLRLVAEIKKASPSKGILRENFDPKEIARIYEAYGAHAISVLTDEKFFQGGIEDLKKVSKTTSLPILRKDFILDSYQVYEAKACGAKAVLLIVAALSQSELGELLKQAEAIGLSTLVEIHNERELAVALESGAKIIGINNRDLKTFKVDLKNAERLCPKIPKGIKVVVESGLETREDVLKVSEWPVDAVLIGEAFMTSSDIAKKMKELMG